MSKSTVLRKRRPESRDVWLERLERYRAYRGTQASFCRDLLHCLELKFLRSLEYSAVI
jgi:hypothetical protein